MNPTLTIAILLVGSYLLGSLPFGLWIVKWLKGVDIRTVGSGNIGATNVGRIAGSRAYAVVFTLDVLKGLLPPLVGHALRLDSGWQVLAALLAIVGHTYSVWLGFKGGKGVATSLGTLLGVAPGVGLIAFAFFGIVLALFHWVSLGSILAALSIPLLMLVFYPGDGYRFAYALFACLMVVYKHRANIQRLLAGNEPKVKMPWEKRKATGENTRGSK